MALPCAASGRSAKEQKHSTARPPRGGMERVEAVGGLDKSGILYSLADSRGQCVVDTGKGHGPVLGQDAVDSGVVDGGFLRAFGTPFDCPNGSAPWSDNLNRLRVAQRPLFVPSFDAAINRHRGLHAEDHPRALCAHHRRRVCLGPQQARQFDPGVHRRGDEACHPLCGRRAHLLPPQPKGRLAEGPGRQAAFP